MDYPNSGTVTVTTSNGIDSLDTKWFILGSDGDTFVYHEPEYIQQFNKRIYEFKQKIKTWKN